MANLSIQNITTLEDQGKALAERFDTFNKVDMKNFNRSLDRKAPKESASAFVKAISGFTLALGNLMVELKAEGGERIKSSRLADCHIKDIPDQRRSEALWFVLNEEEAREFMQTSKKGFTSLSALQRAMKQAAKANTPSSEEDTPEETVQEDTVAETNPNVGANTAPPTKEEIVQSIVKAAAYANVDLLDIAEALMEIDTVSEKEELKVAAQAVTE